MGPTPVHAPTRIGRYDIVRLLGEGGAGRVYEAVLNGPLGFRKGVALKVLRDERRDLVREARLGGLLRHPNVVEVYELGQADGAWYCAMELVTGGTLADHLPLPASAVVDVGMQVCAGLAHAHAEIGLVHLDLKPQNLLVQDGWVLIADLGTARTRDLGGSDPIIGTPGYMSPEHVFGRSVDARSDLYSLGVVLCELATGVRPSPLTEGGEPSPTIAVWTDRTVETPEPAAPPELPEWLAAVASRCLAPHPDDRFADATSLAQALRALEVEGPTLQEVLRQRGASNRSGRPRTVTPAPFTNLTPERDAFVGRRDSLQAALEQLKRPGLVTVVGMAGVGKTRLARRVAARYADATQNHAWFCDLTQARSRRDLWMGLGVGLGLALVDGHEPEQLAAALSRRGSVVVVVDNVEQLVPHADAFAWLADRAPDVRWLLTSRVPLSLSGERLIRLGPLDPDEATTLLRCRAEDRGVPLGEEGALRSLAEQLEGIPLALELAAGRMGALRPADMLPLLDHRLELLRSRRAPTDRHHTLAAALDGSWALLDEAQRRAMVELATFAGGFTLQMAERVLTPGADPLWVVDLVEGLVDASLVVRRHGAPDDDVRFGLLETVRDYARAQGLKLPTELTHRAVRAHAEAFAPLYLEGRGRECTDELDNLLAAFVRMRDAGELGMAVQCLHGAWHGLELVAGPARILELIQTVLDAGPTGQTLGHLLTLRGHLLAIRGDALRARDALQQALPKLGSSPTLRVRALRSLALALRLLGEPDAALQRLQEAQRTEGADEAVAAGALSDLATHLRTVGEFAASARWSRRAIEAQRAAGAGLGLAMAYSHQAVTQADAGRLVEAEGGFLAAIDQLHALGATRFRDTQRANLGVLRAMQGRHEDAIAAYEPLIARLRSDGESASLALWLGNLAELQLTLGRPERARPAVEEAERLTRQTQHVRRRGFVTDLLGQLHLAEEDPEGAHAWFAEALEHSERAKDRLLRVGVLCGLSHAAHQRGDAEAAARWLSEAEAQAADLQLGPDSEGATRIRRTRQAQH
ncbi:MAG: protein kinase [Myxococcales bacterium]|nr:protein kinase [Myxococcales bacterium]